ncbi:MAG: hypothetical protein OSB38_37505, partial [Paraburkholderia fungorum]|nr:hypothetical protein [Paraburkholderia fungorum]
KRFCGGRSIAISTSVGLGSALLRGQPDTGVAWYGGKTPPVLEWVLDYLGDIEKRHREWIS